MRKNKKSPVAAVCSTLGTAILIILIILCIPFTLPKVLNYQVYTVVSGSMEPVIPMGSLIYVKEILPQDVGEGEIIAYYGSRDNNVIITHRVVENRVIMGEFVTKGDANRMEDMNPVKYDFFIGKVEVCIPHGGIVAQLLTSSDGKIAAGSMIGVAIILHLLASIIGKKN